MVAKGSRKLRMRPSAPDPLGSHRMGVVEEPRFKLIAVTFLGEKEIARYPTLEQAEQQAAEMNEHAERNPRGYMQYVVRRTEGAAGAGTRILLDKLADSDRLDVSYRPLGAVGNQRSSLDAS